MANGYNIPAPRGYFPPQTNLRVATPVGGQALPMNTNVGQPSPFYDMRPYQEFFGDPTRDLLASTRAAIAARTKQPLSTPTSIAMPTAPLARSRFLQEQQGVPLPRPRPEGMPPSGLDQLRAAQLRMPAKGTPEAAGLSAAGTQLLAAGGWQDRPVTLGETLASGMQAYTTAKQEAEQLQYDKQRQALADQLALAGFQLDVQKAMTAEPSRARQAAIDIGLDPDSPKGQQWMKEYLMKSGGVTVEAPKTESAYQSELGKYAVTRLKGLDEELLNEQTNIVPRLNLIESALESGSVTTGAGSGFLLDVKRIANTMGVLPSDQIDQLGDQELVQKTISYLIPRYRVAGSGSTSDMEINLFSAAVPSLSTTTRGNLILIKGMKQMSRFKKMYRDQYMNYLSENQGDPTGFEQQFEASGASPFYSPDSNEELDSLVEKGFIREGDVFYDSVSGGFQIYG